MKRYSVSDICKLIGRKHETVRQFIRSGEMKSDYEAGKYGATVTEEDLIDFIHRHPQYKKAFEANYKVAVDKSPLIKHLEELKAFRDDLDKQIVELEFMIQRLG